MAIKDAWEAIPVEELEELVASMKHRCQAVIDADEDTSSIDWIAPLRDQIDGANWPHIGPISSRIAIVRLD